MYIVYSLIVTVTDNCLSTFNKEKRRKVTFAQEADQPPYEVAAVVAEGGLSQGHPPEAVSRSGQPAPLSGSRVLLCLPAPRRRTGAGAAAAADVPVFLPAVLCHAAPGKKKKNYVYTHNA